MNEQELPKLMALIEEVEQEDKAIRVWALKFGRMNETKTRKRKKAE